MTREEVVEKINNNEDVYCVTENKQVINGKTLDGCDVYTDPLYANAEWFKTLEEAEWHKEFGCIERTERLELPTWEEFQNVDDICFVCVKTGKTVTMFNWGYIGENIYISDEWEIREIFEYNKEGYTLACRKAKELFLGQSNDN